MLLIPLWKNVGTVSPVPKYAPMSQAVDPPGRALPRASESSGVNPRLVRFVPAPITADPVSCRPFAFRFRLVVCAMDPASVPPVVAAAQVARELKFVEPICQRFVSEESW